MPPVLSINDFVFKNSRVRSTDTLKTYPKSNPQLPRALWEGFKRDFPGSLIFTRFFSDARHCMLLTGPTPELTSVIPVHLAAISAQRPSADSLNRDFDQGLSYLHLAVLQGDIPLAYEALRLGTSVHCKNKAGDSPLFYACVLLEGFMRNGKFRIVGAPPQVEAELREHVARMCQIALFLIFQHSDPNETNAQGVSVLAFACGIRSWDLIRALLLHGANPHGLATAFNHDEAARARFESLARQFSTAVRPPRICPCGSGHPLRDCHALPQPYPAHYICPCGSRRLHSACCARKTGILWNEWWNEEKGWLDHSPTPRDIRPAHPDENEFAERRLVMAAAMMGVPGANGAPLTPETQWLDKPNLAILQVLADKHGVDPAYMAACKKTMKTPSPTAILAMPRPIWIKTMKEWNNAVDAYIASGVDHRAAGTIEAAAKIGSAGGPLYRRCEAAGCASVESSDLPNAFRHCGGCKTTVYCSPSCQKSAWKAHKPLCRAGNVETQKLPSQEAYAVELAAEVARMTGCKAFTRSPSSR